MYNHNQNEIYKFLAQDSYNSVSKNLPANWSNLNKLNASNLKTGFHSKVYKNNATNEIAISYRGSDSLLDWSSSNRQMFEGKIPRQYYDAIKQYQNIKNVYPNSNITFTGHSLGGSLAQLMSKSTGNSGIAFSPYGTNYIVKEYPNVFNKSAKVINYGRMSDDIFIRNINYQVGNTYTFKSLEQRTKTPEILNRMRVPKTIYESHMIHNYPDLNKAKPYNQKTQYIEDGKIKNFPKNWQEYLNTPKDFSKLQPAKLDELKNPQVQGISGSVSDATIIGMDIIQPQPIILPKKTTSWLSQFGSILSGVSSLIQHGVGTVGGILGGISSNTPANTIDIGISNTNNGFINWPSGMKPFHTGGTVTPKSGRDEVLAILRGGKTVRTEAQEKELQEEKQKAFMETIRPYLEQKDDKPKTIAEAYDPNNKIPCLLNKTTQDEEVIISIIAQAWKSNRLGFRNVLRYE